MQAYRQNTSCTSPFTGGGVQEVRTAAAQLEFTVHLPRLDAGPFTFLGWTPSHALINTGAPIPSGSRFAGRLTRGQGLRTARWTRLFGNLAHASARLGWGRGVPPHAKPSCLGMTTATATGFALPAVFSRLPPASLRPPGGGASCWVAAGRLTPRSALLRKDSAAP